MSLFFFMGVRAATAAPEPPVDGRTEALTLDLERIYGTLRFDDLRDQLAVRLTADGSQSEYHDRQTSLQAKLITQFFVVKEVQDWVNKKLNEEQHKLQDDISREAKKIETDIKDEYDREFRHSPQNPALASRGTEEKSTLTHGKNPKTRKDPWNISSDTRVNYDRGVDLFAHIRVRRDFRAEPWLHSLSFEAGWDTQELWTAQINTDSHRALTDICLLTWSNLFFRSLSQGVMTTSHGPSLAWTLADQQAISLGAGMQTRQTFGEWRAESYILSTDYRWETWKNRLFLSVNPYTLFEANNNFRRDVGLKLSLEITI